MLVIGDVLGIPGSSVLVEVEVAVGFVTEIGNKLSSVVVVVFPYDASINTIEMKMTKNLTPINTPPRKATPDLLLHRPEALT